MTRKINIKNIGIAILSTDRPECTKRILDSIERKTATSDICVFLCDDSTPEYKNEIIDICNRSWVNFFDTGSRIGVAKNTNRAMQLLESFDFKIIMNNDVEVLKSNWIFFYPVAMVKTGFHHFCFQQEGLWGAGTEKRPQKIWEKNGCTIKTIDNYPQGAILAYDQKAFQTVGYFDAENFKSYGFSHWMWSFSVSESKIQPKGIHDIVGSNKYFKVYDELSCTNINDRVESYSRNRVIFDTEFQKLKDFKRPKYTSYS